MTSSASNNQLVRERNHLFSESRYCIRDLERKVIDHSLRVDELSSILSSILSSTLSDFPAEKGIDPIGDCTTLDTDNRDGRDVSGMVYMASSLLASVALNLHDSNLRSIQV